MRCMPLLALAPPWPWLAAPLPLLCQEFVCKKEVTKEVHLWRKGHAFGCQASWLNQTQHNATAMHMQ